MKIGTIVEAIRLAGLVTTDSVTGASAAATYAHSADREYTSSVPKGCHAKDIAEQLIHGDTGSRLKVIFGGGLSDFLPEKSKPKEQRMIEGDGLPINARGDRFVNFTKYESVLQTLNLVLFTVDKVAVHGPRSLSFLAFPGKMDGI